MLGFAHPCSSPKGWQLWWSKVPTLPPVSYGAPTPPRYSEKTAVAISAIKCVLPGTSESLMTECPLVRCYIPSLLIESVQSPPPHPPDAPSLLIAKTFLFNQLRGINHRGFYFSCRENVISKEANLVFGGPREGLRSISPSV